MPGVTAQKRGSTWRYRFDGAMVDGKRKQFSKGGFATKKEAIAAGTEAFAEYNSTGRVSERSKMSFSDYLDYWMESYCEVNMKPGTITNYQKLIRIHIKPSVGAYRMSALSHDALQGVINRMFDSGYSRRTINVAKGIMTGSLRYAVEPLRLLKQNPASFLKVPPSRAIPKEKTRESPHVYIPKDAMEKIFKRFPEGTSAHIPLQIGYHCGLRISEVFGLTWDDIDFENSVMHVRRQMLWDTKIGAWYMTEPKYNSVRSIGFDNELKELLARRKERVEEEKRRYGDSYRRYYLSDRQIINSEGDGVEIALLNVNRDGRIITPNTIHHASRVIQHEMKFHEFDFHSLRHTHATMLAEAGAPIKYVQARMGHKSVEMTMRVYQHVSESIKEQGDSMLGMIYGK